jgi:hypothetical protein
MQVAVYHFLPLLTIFHLFTATGAENGEGIDKLVKYSPKKPFRGDIRKGFRQLVVMPFFDVVHLFVLFKVWMMIWNCWSVFITCVRYTLTGEIFLFKLVPCFLLCFRNSRFVFFCLIGSGECGLEGWVRCDLPEQILPSQPLFRIPGKRLFEISQTAKLVEDSVFTLVKVELVGVVAMNVMIVTSSCV